MALVINHNMMAEVALGNLAATYKTLAESINALSSGLRINSADDDAAGLAVRELMRAEIAALTQGVRNANDAISMLQTFDGAAQVIDEKLVRMKELALQAATGTYSDAQRTLMNSEFGQMREEITRIASATTFNGIYGLNASGTIKIHFGSGNSSAEDYYYVTQQDMTATTLGVGTLTIASQASAQASLTTIDSAINTKDTARAHFGAMMNRLENTIANLEIQRENVQAAESQISDVDVAWEIANLTRNQVLAQAGIAMLAQANAVPLMALGLLG
ncbi:MAG: flagellin N-terminal helical domain-containing protein [Planctomycetota bacterium]|jgi:flagellin